MSYRDHDPYFPFDNYGRSFRFAPVIPQFIPVRRVTEPSREPHERYPWQGMEARAVAGAFGLNGLPTLQPHSHVRILVLESGFPQGQLTGEPILDSFTSTQQAQSKLTQEEQTKALKELKREVYNPIPNNLGRRLCLYYRDEAKNLVNEMAKKRQEEGKRCAVCLEDFEPKESVMMTPCNHMFHEECIVPWVKSNGQCPVCRFLLFEQRNAPMQ